MKWVRWVLCAATACAFMTTTAFAADECDEDEDDRDELELFADELDERDFAAVAEYVNTKRAEDLEADACALEISGDIRAEWSHITEVLNGRKLRGGHISRCGSGFVSTNDFDIDLNLRFDYKCEDAWGVVHIEFDNPAGVQEIDKVCGDYPAVYDPCSKIDRQSTYGSGQCNSICLRKAFIGYNICACGKTRFDIEVGRRRLYDVFDSRIQFLARFDGVLLRYATQLLNDTNFYWNAGAFVVDERVDHFAFVGETGLLNICDSGFDVKYSFIQWRKRGFNRCLIRDALGWRFSNSQWTAAYKFKDLLCIPAKIYGAYIYNHAAERRPITRNHLYNNAWYIGGTIGEVRKEGDWMIDGNYQYCEAQSVPDADMGGIGRGNFFKETFYTADFYDNPLNARGDTNFKGFKIEGLYALTDDLSIDTYFQLSRPIDKRLGGPMHYSKFKIEAIYAF